MINIDTRPDLINLLIELNHYNCTFIKENQILIEIPQFINKQADPWYGLSLVCKPNRTSIDIYVCKNKERLETNAYIGSFDNFKSLEDLINTAIEQIYICDNCGKTTELNNLYINKNKILCLDCNNIIRSKY